MLETDELKRRIDAARTIRGLRQVDLAALVESDGLGKQTVGRLERGDIPLTRALRRSLADHLAVPESWFVDDHLDLNGGAQDTGQLDRIEAKLDLLLTALGLVQDQARDASSEFVVPTVPQSLRDALNPERADSQRARESQQRRR